jgi:hypothetical protein
MGRPPIYDSPMSEAERMRRYRARKRAPERPDPLLALYGRNNKVIARKLGISLRKYQYMSAFVRHRLIEWDPQICSKYGKVGFAFLAEVCRFSDAGTQQLVNDMIKEHGAAYAKQVWRAAKADNSFDQAEGDE